MKKLYSILITKMRSLSFCILLIVCLGSTSNATNLKFKDVTLPVSIINNGNLQIVFKVANDNVLEAQNYTVKFEFFNKITNKLVFSNEIVGKNLKPFKDTAFTYFLAWYFGFGYIKTKMTINFADDINLSDNIYNGEFKSYASRSEASEAVDDYLNTNFPMKYKPNLSYLNMSWDILPKTTMITTNGNEYNIKLTDDKWLGWVNYDKYSRFGGSTGLVLLDPLSLEIDYYDSQWQPKVTGTVEYDPYDTLGIVFGNNRLMTTQSSGNTVADSTGPSKPIKACAILVSGVDKENPDMETAFNNDLDIMKVNLKNETFGPRLAEGDIVVLKNADSATLHNELKKLKDKCDNVYFFYSGHGSEHGFMELGGTGLGIPYWTLFDELYGSGAQDIHVLIDACYAGTAVKWAQLDTRFSETNIEVIASSDSTKSSRNNRISTDVFEITYGAYNWFFILGFGQPEADTDKDGKTSFFEAAQWVKKQDPSLSRGDKLDTLQRPIHIRNIRKPAIRTRQEVAQTIKENIYDYYPDYDTTKSVIYLEMDTTKTGTRIKSYDGDYYEYLDSTKYIGWIDWEINAGFSHKVSYLLVDPYEPDSMKIIDNDWWPVIGDSIKYKPFDDKKIILGDLYYNLKSGLDTITYTSAPDSSIAKDTCVLLVSGPDDRALMQNAMRNGVVNIKMLLSRNYLGPKIPESKIQVMNEPTEAELTAKINSLKDKCSKIYFYYVGHGSSTGWFQLKGGLMSYEKLFPLLYDANADDYSILFDCCYSGLARAAMEKDPRHITKDIELITASNNSKYSWYNTITAGNEVFTYALFTRLLALGSVDGSSDVNKDGQVSWGEAYDWIIAHNPEDTEGRKADTLMRPTYTIIRSIKSNNQQPISFPGSDLKIIPNSTISEETEFRLKLSYDDFGLNKISNEIKYISPTRYWNLEINPTNTKFDVNLEFTPSETIDSIFNKPGFKGIVTREDPTKPWVPYYPTIWDDTKKILIGKGVKSFSDWALAVLDSDPNGIEEGGESLRSISYMNAFPNPFKGSNTVKVVLNEDTRINLELIDSRGIILKTIESGYYTTGTYYFNFECNELVAGLYFIRLNAGKTTEQIKIINSN